MSNRKRKFSWDPTSFSKHLMHICTVGFTPRHDDHRLCVSPLPNCELILGRWPVLPTLVAVTDPIPTPPPSPAQHQTHGSPSPSCPTLLPTIHPDTLLALPVRKRKHGAFRVYRQNCPTLNPNQFSSFVLTTLTTFLHP